MTTPFQLAAGDYFAAGWPTVPLPIGEKHPPPDGFTGADGRNPTAEDIAAWTRSRPARLKAGNLSFPPGNIAIRMPDNVIGIDVDAHSGKAGAETFRSAEKKWGPLPATWISTARTGGSGIRFFRVPPGLAWPGDLRRAGVGAGVDLIRWDHRFAVVFPSTNPHAAGAMYFWIRPDGEVVTDEIPAVDDLPELPLAWVDGLTGGAEWKGHGSGTEVSAQGARDWILSWGSGAVCSVMSATLTKYSRAVRAAGDDGGAHDIARDGAWALLGDAAAGHAGLSLALPKLRAVFLTAVKGRRSARVARAEWAGIVIRGVSKVAAEGEPESADMCALVDGSASPGAAVPESIYAPYAFNRDDAGNGARLAAAYRHEMLHCEALGGWHVYRDGIWAPDARQVRRWALRVVERMREQADTIEEPKLKVAYLKFLGGLGNEGKLKSMVSMAADVAGMDAPASTFDANGRHLVLPNGKTLVLESEGVRRVASVPEHRNTRRAGAVPSGRGRRAWEAFLARFQPDREVLDWLQMLVGYSLLGGNPDRIMVFCHGQTSSGKTTFARVLRAALGDYAGGANLTIFRDNQDERPRPDLVRALDQRMVFVEETSAQWHLHPDQIKRLTGAAPISARLPYAKEYVERLPQFVPWVLTNGIPTIDGNDKALLRRLVVVPFDVVIPKDEEVEDYTERLCAGSAGAAFRWSLQGYEAARGRNLTDVPAGAVLANMRFREGLSELDAFIAQACECAAEYSERPIRLYDAYTQWCSMNGVKEREVMSATAFGRQMAGKGHDRRRVRDGAELTWVREGIRLSKEWGQIS